MFVCMCVCVWGGVDSKKELLPYFRDNTHNDDKGGDDYNAS